MSSLTPRDLYEEYSAAVAYISVRLASGDLSIGSAFHVGDGVFLTARHVVENVEILKIANTVHHQVRDPNGSVQIHGREGQYRNISPSIGRITSGPYFHPDDSVDVAALVVEGIECTTIPLGSHLDDWINDDAFVLRQVLVMGYPPVPLSREPVLIASRAEINAIVDKYVGPHPHFIISSMARGGFSGGPCLIEWDFALGLVTESLVRDGSPIELGYSSVISVEPLLMCMAHHNILPAALKELWGDTWNVATPGDS